MDNLSDEPLPLRGPSLPGSLGVRIRGDWETFEEENTGIDMRSGDCTDINVQIDLMKETESHERNRSDCGVFGENNDIERCSNVKIDSIEEQGTCKPTNRGTWETFNEEGMKESREDKTNIRIDLMKGESGQEQDLDETGRKCPMSHVRPGTTPFNDVTVPQDSHEPQLAVPTPYQEGDFSLNSSFLRQPSTSKYPTLPLPSGKKYHVFFSYEMADRDWVHSVVNKMESEHGYRCSFHERDFHGGKRVIENILEHIQWSVKTVLVLSPDFLESSWCQFEMKQGLHASIEEARMLIVPVMVRECEVPDTLRSLTYIDATPGTDWWDRLFEALTSQDTLQVCNDAGNQIAIQPRYENLDVLCELTSKFRCCFGEKLELPYVPEELNKPGIEMSQAEFDNVMSSLSEALDTNWVNRFCFDYIPFCAPITTAICALTLIFIGIGIMMVLTEETSAGIMKGRCLIFSPIPFPFIFAAGFFAQMRWRKRRIRKAVIELNQRLFGSKVIMDVNVSSFGHCSSIRVKITVRFYDFQPCMNHIQDFMSNTEETFRRTGFSVDSERLAIPMLEEYLQEYRDGKLKFLGGSNPRHVRHAKCFCQFIEGTL